MAEGACVTGAQARRRQADLPRPNLRIIPRNPSFGYARSNLNHGRAIYRKVAPDNIARTKRELAHPPFRLGGGYLG